MSSTPSALNAEALDAALATELPPPPPLGDRLRAIERVLVSLGSTCNHPRELAARAQFKDAVGVFENLDIDLDTVVRYALGPDWGIACAALAALATRPDGNDAVDQILIQFDKLVPWAVYFALAYFVAIVPRPPVGAPLVSAKDHWRNMPVLSQLFRDYFVQRAKLGDAAEFGGALYSQAASPTPIIKAFLESVDHPLATALVGRLELRSRRAISIMRSWPRSAASGRIRSSRRAWSSRTAGARRSPPPNPRCCRLRSARSW